MAQKVSIQLVDDIDGSEAVETVSFGLDGSTYEIDLNEKNASELRDAFAPYVGVARRAGRSAPAARSTTRRTRPTTTTTSLVAAAAAEGPSPQDIRDWARTQGLQVSERGRISGEVREKYNAAHS